MSTAYQISDARGYKVYQLEKDGDWFYEDGTPCTRTSQKPCLACGLTPVPWSQQNKKTTYLFTEVNFPMDWGPDPCLGVLDDVRAACCGHGIGEGYVFVESTGKTLRVKEYFEGARFDLNGLVLD